MGWNLLCVFVRGLWSQVGRFCIGELKRTASRTSLVWYISKGVWRKATIGTPSSATHGRVGGWVRPHAIEAGEAEAKSERRRASAGRGQLHNRGAPPPPL